MSTCYTTYPQVQTMSNPWNLQQNHHCGGDAGNSNSAGNNPSGNPGARNGWPVENGRGNIGYNTAETGANCGAYYPSADRIGFSMQQVMQQQPIQNAVPFLSNNTGSFNGAYNAAPFAPLNAVSSAGTYPAIGGPCFSAGVQQQQHLQQQHMQQQLRQGSQFAPFAPQPQPMNTPSFTLPAEPDMADSNLMNWAMRTVENSKHEHHEETDQVEAQQRGPTSVRKGVKEEPVKECQMARETSRRESFTFQASPIEGTFGSKKAKTQLPQDFKPGPHSVILGRGRCTESVGNKAFKIIVSEHLAEYVEAPGKLEKTQIVTKVINIVKEMCPIGAFVKYENGNWFSVGERAAREKVGACFRDALHTNYKSSSKSKEARRLSSA